MCCHDKSCTLNELVHDISSKNIYKYWDRRRRREKQMFVCLSDIFTQMNWLNMWLIIHLFAFSSEIVMVMIFCVAHTMIRRRLVNLLMRWKAKIMMIFWLGNWWQLNYWTKYDWEHKIILSNWYQIDDEFNSFSLNYSTINMTYILVYK